MIEVIFQMREHPIIHLNLQIQCSDMGGWVGFGVRISSEEKNMYTQKFFCRECLDLGVDGWFSINLNIVLI